MGEHDHRYGHLTLPRDSADFREWVRQHAQAHGFELDAHPGAGLRRTGGRCAAAQMGIALCPCDGSLSQDRYQQVMACDVERFKKFFHGMLAAGVYLAPSAFEAGFVSATHSDDEINATLDAAQKAFAAL